MKRFLAIALLIPALAAGYEEFEANRYCAEYTEQGVDEKMQVDSWIKGFFAGKKNGQAYRDESREFTSKVIDLCMASSTLELDDAANAVFISGDYK